jgi:NhaP-type Na+/H+ and K+/H+ antiporter
VVRALVLSLGFVLMAFGAFIAWLPFRQPERERELLAWGLARGGFDIAVGATVVVAMLMPDATRYAAGGVAVLLLAKLLKA